MANPRIHPHLFSKSIRFGDCEEIPLTLSGVYHRHETPGQPLYRLLDGAVKAAPGANRSIVKDGF